MRTLTVFVVVSLLLGSSHIVQAQPPKFLASDFTVGTVLETRDANGEEVEMWGSKGWAIDGTVKVLPWLGIAGVLVRSSPSDLPATHALAGPRVSTRFICGPTGQTIDYMCVRLFAHALAGATVPRTAGQSTGRELVLGGGGDVLIMRMQLDWVRSSVAGVDNVRGFLGVVVPLCFRGCTVADGFGVGKQAP